VDRSDKAALRTYPIEITAFFTNVSSAPREEIILPRDETIFCFSADVRKRRLVIRLPTKRRATPTANTGDSQMRTLCFLLSFAFVLAGPSLAGSSDNGLPGIGTFAYNASPISASSPAAMVVAAR
jgi:hypothetical protein